MHPIRVFLRNRQELESIALSHHACNLRVIGLPNRDSEGVLSGELRVMVDPDRCMTELDLKSAEAALSAVVGRVVQLVAALPSQALDRADMPDEDMDAEQVHDDMDEENDSEDAFLPPCVDALASAIAQIQMYIRDCDREDFRDDRLRQDAVAHNLSAIAHGVLGLQDLPGFQPYEPVLNPWLHYCWDFSWLPMDKVDLDEVWEIIHQDLPQFEADLARIRSEQFSE
ncbi:HepT-like ribonuclease domain-containing protein [Achromobacter pestifer]|uniref:Uncharacterized protein n=1 Tax=Achromobacter pestifer TaxID=1353889 RepID=A0A6S6ZZR7_9BURK|nr:hypothetical protein [Achromobacter pestifer]CAB3647304.1 hypothetical protein LMG3431_02557 [Achromobacter pestifer]